MTRVLVTGGAGLLGSHLIELLLADGHEVTALDDFSTGYRRNLQEAASHRRFTLLEGDVRDTALVRRAAGSVSAIAHLAAWKIPVGTMSARTVLEVNVEGTRSVLEAAAASGCKVAFASTSDVYGKWRGSPFKETDDLLLGPSTVSRWAYAASKIYDEHLCLAYAREVGIPTVIIRVFNTYGPRNDTTLVSGGPQALFIEAALEGRDLTVYGSGEQRRCFAYVSDVVEAFGSALLTDRADGEIVNVGNDQTEITINELARRIIDLAGSRSRVVHIGHDALAPNYEDVGRRIPDLTKARTLLGFAPGVGLDEGLALTLSWHRALREAETARR